MDGAAQPVARRDETDQFSSNDDLPSIASLALVTRKTLTTLLSHCCPSIADTRVRPRSLHQVRRLIL